MKRFLLLAPLLLLLAGTTKAQATFTVFYVVTAVNSNGSQSVNSNQATAAVPQQGTHTVALSWTEADVTAVSYNVFRGKVSGGPYTQVNTTPVTVLTFTDTFSPPAAPVLGTPVVN